MRQKEILIDPCYEVIFKSSLDELMKQVRREQLMDVCTRETMCKGLEDEMFNSHTQTHNQS
jgi:hypothetical protein